VAISTPNSSGNLGQERRDLETEVKLQAGGYALGHTGVRTELIVTSGGGELREDTKLAEARYRILQNSVEAPFGD
jgi:hypothetical protein